jgi:hypothetical protein
MGRDSVTVEKTNAKQFPKIFYARHMETGLAKYDDGTLLIDADGMKNMLPSFVGKPIYIEHQDVKLDTLKEEAAGYVVESFYNELDGWGWVKFIAVDDEVHEAIAKDWSVSNAYIPMQFGDGGEHHSVPFDRRVLDGTFTHLAIVSNPRYEEAGIYTPDEFKAYQASQVAKLEQLELRNSKSKGTTMKIWNREKKEAASLEEVTPDSLTEVTNDKGESEEVTLGTLIEHWNAKKNMKKNAEKVNMDAQIDVGDGEMVAMKDLVNSYCTNKKNAKKNDDADQDDDVENADDDEKEEDKKAKENKNSKSKSKADDDDDSGEEGFFNELRNANKKAPQVHTIDTSHDKLIRGKQRYGSGN